LKVVSR